MRGHRLGVQRRIRDCWKKANGPNVCGEADIPGARGLFQAVKGFVEKTNVILFRGANETGWLLTIYCFVEIVVKKSIFNIQFR